MNDSSARILVIEDSLIQVRLIEALLNQHGDGEFTLECADTLKAGLRLLVRGGIDVVLLDLTLPHRSRESTVGGSPSLPTPFHSERYWLKLDNKRCIGSWLIVIMPPCGWFKSSVIQTQRETSSTKPTPVVSSRSSNFPCCMPI